MKKIFSGLLIGLFVVVLSGMAGAEEWQTKKLPDGVKLEFQMPADFTTYQEDSHEEAGNKMYVHGYLAPKEPLMLLVQKMIPASPESFPYSGRYGLDGLTKEKEAEYLGKMKALGMENPELITLPSGHRAAVGNRKDTAGEWKYFFVYVDSAQIMIVLYKKGTMNQNDEKLAMKIFESALF